MSFNKTKQNPITFGKIIKWNKLQFSPFQILKVSFMISKIFLPFYGTTNCKIKCLLASTATTTKNNNKNKQTNS